MRFSIRKLEEDYDINLDEIASKLREFKGKKVMFQFPEGLKPWAVPIVELIEEKTGVFPLIWFGDCFGACDIPKSDYDVLVQFGHAPWKYSYDGTAIPRKEQKKII